MDPYFKPILIAGSVVILLNTVFIMPFAWAPLLSYVIGGMITVALFASDFKKRAGDFAEIKVSDVLILGLGAGIFAGAVLSLVLALKLQEPSTKQFLIDAINQAMKMRSEAEFRRLDDIGPVFLFMMSIVTIFICSLGTSFGALSLLPFLQTKRK